MKQIIRSIVMTIAVLAGLQSLNLGGMEEEWVPSSKYAPPAQAYNPRATAEKRSQAAAGVSRAAESVQGEEERMGERKELHLYHHYEDFPDSEGTRKEQGKTVYIPEYNSEKIVVVKSDIKSVADIIMKLYRSSVLLTVNPLLYLFFYDQNCRLTSTVIAQGKLAGLVYDRYLQDQSIGSAGRVATWRNFITNYYKNGQEYITFAQRAKALFVTHIGEKINQVNKDIDVFYRKNFSAIERTVNYLTEAGAETVRKAGRQAVKAAGYFKKKEQAQQEESVGKESGKLIAELRAEEKAVNSVEETYTFETNDWKYLLYALRMQDVTTQGINENSLFDTLIFDWNKQARSIEDIKKMPNVPASMTELEDSFKAYTALLRTTFKIFYYLAEVDNLLEVGNPLRPKAGKIKQTMTAFDKINGSKRLIIAVRAEQKRLSNEFDIYIKWLRASLEKMRTTYKLKTSWFS